MSCDFHPAELIAMHLGARQMAAESPEQPTFQELRKRHGTNDDDDLILRALMPAADVQKMREAGPLRRDCPLLSSPEMEEIARLLRMTTGSLVHYATPEFEIVLRR